MSTGSGPELPGKDELSLPWCLLYIFLALVISFLYYRNPGLWRLIENLGK
ncbi:MAG: hypothetical protein IMW96_07205 [Thermoanaerobacteraceae bacterium]|nr:hypothetical protein [Thermanaeromonas sp. C210]MBE3581402.1 hypothetical protein [Thermoanaerobacteraceae bacterium]GFN21991.1 hypothetical protein TAMC210_03070 [Thermanaeromonas sp. C210]